MDLINKLGHNKLIKEEIEEEEETFLDIFKNNSSFNKYIYAKYGSMAI